MATPTPTATPRDRTKKTGTVEQRALVLEELQTGPEGPRTSEIAQRTGLSLSLTVAILKHYEGRGAVCRFRTSKGATAWEVVSKGSE